MGGVVRIVRRPLVILAAGVLAVLVGTAIVRWTGPRSHPRAAAGGPSVVYASDGHTPIVRFDGDPDTACERVAHGDWAFFCDYLVAWWGSQPSLGDDPAARLDRLRTGGYRIVASLDPALQAAAERHVEEQVPTGDPRTLNVVSVQPGTGRVLAVATNRDYRPLPSPTARPAPLTEHPPTPAPVLGYLADGTTPVYGTQGGATFMPFTIATALEQDIPLGYTIDTKQRYQSGYIIDGSSRAACAGNHYCPANSGDPAYLSGPRTMWDALTHQVVTYFVPLEERVGAQNVVATASRLGIGFTGSDALLVEHASQWGAFTLGVSRVTPLDLANAYATLAADGTRCAPTPVRAITDPAGHALAAGEPACSAVLRPDVARATLDAARCGVGDSSAFGDRCGTGVGVAGSVRQRVGRPVAGVLARAEAVGGQVLAVAGPQLATVGTLADLSCSGCHPVPPGDASLVVAATADTEHDGLAPLPARDLTPPAARYALGG